MEVQVIYTIWLREMKRFIRARSRIIGNIATPFVWFILMGVGMNSTLFSMDFNYFTFIAPGVIGMALLFNSIFAGISVIWDKQFGFLKEILVAPVSRQSIVLGKILGSSTISLINGLLILLIAIVLGSLQLSSLTLLGLAASIIFMLLIAFSFVSIGLAIASKLSNLEGFQLIMSFLVMPIFLLSGAFFPIDNVPVWMKILVYFDPLLYGVDGLRASLIGTSYFPLFVNFGVLIFFCTIMILLSSYLFSRMEV